jgi:hypothetical protein
MKESLVASKRQKALYIQNYPCKHTILYPMQMISVNAKIESIYMIALVLHSFMIHVSPNGFCYLIRMQVKSPLSISSPHLSKSPPSMKKLIWLYNWVMYNNFALYVYVYVFIKKIMRDPTERDYIIWIAFIR